MRSKCRMGIFQFGGKDYHVVHCPNVPPDKMFFLQVDIIRCVDCDREDDSDTKDPTNA